MLVKHSLFYLIARGLPGLINLLALALYTRLLSPEDYGRYALVVVGAGLVGAILFQWLQLGLLRFLAAKQNDRQIFLSTIWSGFLVVVGVGCCITLIAASIIADASLRVLVVLGLMLLVFQAFFDMNQELERSLFSHLRYGSYALARATLSLSFGGLLTWQGWGAEGLLIGMIAGNFFPLISQYRSRWRGVNVRLRNPQILRQLLSYGLPLTVTFALGFIVSSSDRFLLGMLLNVEAAGLYTVAYNFSQQSLGMLLMIVNLAAYPLAVRALEQEGQVEARLQLRRNGTLLLGTALPAAAGMAILAPNIAQVFLGESYRLAAGSLIPWIAVGALIAGIKAFHFDLSFHLGQRTVVQVWVVLITALVNVALNFLLIPRFGLYGSAYANVAAYLIGLVLSIVIGGRIFRIPLDGLDFFKISLATACLLAALWSWRGGTDLLLLIIKVIYGGAVYGFVLLLLNVAETRTRLINELRERWKLRLCANLEKAKR